jgi:hypothetical protein
MGTAGWILIKFDFGEYYEKLSWHFNLRLDVTVLMTTLHEDLHMFMHVSQP